MATEVIEFELRCREHGMQSALMPADLPRPRRCPQCLVVVESWREVRRFRSKEIPAVIGSEAWIG